MPRCAGRGTAEGSTGNFRQALRIHLKLLQIYANRKMRSRSRELRATCRQATGGAGAIWDQAVALGYQVDPGNTRYAAGKSAAARRSLQAPRQQPPCGECGLQHGGSEDSQATTTDIDLGEAQPVDRNRPPAAARIHRFVTALRR